MAARLTATEAGDRSRVVKALLQIPYALLLWPPQAERTSLVAPVFRWLQVLCDQSLDVLNTVAAHPAVLPTFLSVELQVSNPFPSNSLLFYLFI